MDATGMNVPFTSLSLFAAVTSKTTAEGAKSMCQQIQTSTWRQKQTSWRDAFKTRLPFKKETLLHTTNKKSLTGQKQFNPKKKAKEQINGCLLD